MKKTVIFLGLVIIFIMKGLAQTKSINVDNYYSTYSYRSLPSTPLDPIYFSYAVKVSIIGAQRGGISKEELTGLTSIAGQVKVDKPSDANVVVELTIGNIIVTDRSVKERKQEYKDKSGKVTTSYYYRVVATYTFESSYIIRKEQEVLLNGYIYSNMNRMTYESGEYNTYDAAAASWNDNKEALVSQFYRDLSLKSAASLSETASKRYGFLPQTNRDLLKTINEKKHNENEAFRAATSSLKDALEATTPDVPLDRDRMNGIIEYYKSIPERFTDPTHKADVRLRYTAWYNLCKIYLYLDEPEKVEEYAQLITTNDYDSKDGAKLLKEANELKAIFDKTGIRTRHFIPEEYFSSQE